MPSQRTLAVVSLGGGVQSSVMALMASQRGFDRTPDCATFADARWEPPSVYAYIECLRDRLSFPLHIVDNGPSLRENVNDSFDQSAHTTGSARVSPTKELRLSKIRSPMPSCPLH